MPRALETIVGYVASGTGTATYDALTNNQNQSYTVRAYQAGAAWLEDVWGATSAAQWLLSLKSPRMHDDVLGMQFAVSAYTNTGSTVIFNPQSLMPGFQQQMLYSTDTLNVSALAATATNKFVGTFNVRYEDLPGIAARLFTWDQIRPQIANLVGVEVQPQASATVGVFGSGVALNSVTTRLKANTDYALLGYSTSIPVAAIVIQGVDTGNLYLGGPGLPNTADTGSFFIDRSVAYQTPHIPVFNSLNQGGTFVFCADITASTHPNVVLHFAEMKQLMGNPA
jgi:hypothetical protein